MEAQFEPTLHLSSLSLAVSTAVATYFGYKCFKAPPPARKTSTKASESEPDSLNRFGLIWIAHAFRFVVILSGAARCLLTVVWPLRPSVMCPNPGNLDPRLFVWSTYNIVSILLVCIGGAIRIASYHQLQGNFTFELNKPNHLVVDGIYQYIQHPGYAGGWACGLGIITFFARFEAGLGCYVPASVSRLSSTTNLAMVVAVFIPVFLVRVIEEEKMLKRAFGEQWSQYHKRTKRFVPGIV